MKTLALAALVVAAFNPATANADERDKLTWRALRANCAALDLYHWDRQILHPEVEDFYRAYLEGAALLHGEEGIRNAYRKACRSGFNVSVREAMTIAVKTVVPEPEAPPKPEPTVEEALAKARLELTDAQSHRNFWAARIVEHEAKITEIEARIAAKASSN